jgi:hypothetical protein
MTTDLLLRLCLRLRARNFAQQASALFLRATALHRMPPLGMPASYPLAA